MHNFIKGSLVIEGHIFDIYIDNYKCCRSSNAHKKATDSLKTSNETYFISGRGVLVEMSIGSHSNDCRYSFGVIPNHYIQRLDNPFFRAEY